MLTLLIDLIAYLLTVILAATAALLLLYDIALIYAMIRLLRSRYFRR